MPVLSAVHHCRRRAACSRIACSIVAMSSPRFSLKDILVSTVNALPQKVKDSLPYLEPEKPTSAWRYPVSTPYIHPHAKASVVEAIENGLISSATKPVRNFEEKLKSLFELPTAKACSSGYTGLLLCLKAANIGPNDEVIVPALTMIAVANAVIDVGAKLVIADVAAEGDYNPSVEQYRERLSSRTRAIVVCHTYGIPADLDPIRRLCDDNRLVLIEDIAEAIGTTYKGRLVGRTGDFAAASLYANKLITSGDGGFVLSKHERWDDDGVLLHDRLQSYVNHGFVPEYHFMHLYRSGNYKMSGLEAAFVAPAVDDVWKVAERREEIASWYREFLADLPDVVLMPTSKFGPDTPWVFGVEVESKEKRRSLRRVLAENGIETRDYFLPLHLQPPLLLHQRQRDSHYELPDLPNAERLGRVGFYLPTHHYLQKSDVEFICNVIRRDRLKISGK
ncbi:GDP-perosamine synthase-like [Oscarella lobularis]|uniref:GDP-perosamine synthase-like n=1 Tax=Oscarella lobularis TaxID=121494 RepID=UPI003313F9FA